MPPVPPVPEVPALPVVPAPPVVPPQPPQSEGQVEQVSPWSQRPLPQKVWAADDTSVTAFGLSLVGWSMQATSISPAPETTVAKFRTVRDRFMVSSWKGQEHSRSARLAGG